MLKLPYKLRGNQQEIIDSIRSTIDAKNHMVLEAPTGSGKTFSSLAATFNLVGSSLSEEKTSSLSKSDVNEETEEMILAEDKDNDETSLEDPSTYPYTSDYSTTAY